MSIRNFLFSAISIPFFTLVGCDGQQDTSTKPTKTPPQTTNTKTKSDAFVKAPKTLAQANPQATTNPKDPTDGKARASARAKNPLQQTLNNDLEEELKNKNFEWNQNIVTKIKTFFQKQNITLNHAASISDENGQGQQTLFMFEKPGSQVIAVRYRPAAKDQDAFFDVTGFEDGRINNDALEYEVVNIGDKLEKDGKPVQGLGNRSVPVVELSTLNLSNESIAVLKEQLSKREDLKFDPEKDRIHVILPEIRKVKVTEANNNSVENSATENQTTVEIENPPVIRVALRVGNTNDIEVILKAKRAEDGNLIEVDTDKPKHLNLDGKPVPNRTEIKNKGFKIYQ